MSVLVHSFIHLYQSALNREQAALHYSVEEKLCAYKQGGVCPGTGDLFWSLDFGIHPTEVDSNVPGWETFDPPH